MKDWARRFESLFAEDPAEPSFDPVHLAGVLVGAMAAIGALYWLLWTLLVYEGGLFLKARAALDVAFTSRNLADYGYEGAPYAMGTFEGWVGNVAALALLCVALIALHQTYRRADRRHRAR